MNEACELKAKIRGIYNERTIYFILNKINNERSLKVMELTKNEEKLAVEIAKTLDDMESLDFHRGLTKQFSESFLREKLTIVLDTPKDKIKRSRAAYFTYLVSQSNFSKKRYAGN